MPIEYDNNSSQIPRAKRLFFCKTKQIIMNIIHTVQDVSKKRKQRNIHDYRCYKSKFKAVLRTRLYLDNCADRIR